MKKYYFLLLAIVSVFLLTSCENSSVISDDTENSIIHEEPTTDNLIVPSSPQNVSDISDYAEVILNSDAYDGKIIIVAGRIAEFSSTNDSEFDFRDCLNFEEAGNGFTVHLAQSFKYGEGASDYYTVDEYVLVQGVWKSGIYKCLDDAIVLNTGDDAKEIANMYLEQWNLRGISYSNTLPLTDYMDIVANPEQFDGQRIRTAGKIQALGTNMATHHIHFLFRDRNTNYTAISFSLKGCPIEMQSLCKENEFVIITGIVHASSGSTSISNCYVECVGHEAEQLSAEAESAWLEGYHTVRDQYIATCNNYSYDELARYPEKNIDTAIKISGIVLQVDIIWGENVILLDIGNNNLVYISYAGKQYQDPEILEGDVITFYGDCAGIKTYTTVLGNNNTIPLVVASYSNINQ
ncbi:MAG: hypothetical protein RSA90_08520 [Lachnospiraceae bacterium]